MNSEGKHLKRQMLAFEARDGCSELEDSLFPEHELRGAGRNDRSGKMLTNRMDYDYDYDYDIMSFITNVGCIVSARRSAKECDNPICGYP